MTECRYCHRPVYPDPGNPHAWFDDGHTYICPDASADSTVVAEHAPTARTVAEQIVRGVENDMPCRLCDASRESRRRLVVALAAAIATVEHYTNGSAYMEQVLDEQTDAVSALRGET